MTELNNEDFMKFWKIIFPVIFISMKTCLACSATDPVQNLDYFDISAFDLTMDCFSGGHHSGASSMQELAKKANGSDYENFDPKTKLLIDRSVMLKCFQDGSNCSYLKEAEQCMFSKFLIDEELIVNYILKREYEADLSRIPQITIRSCYHHSGLQDSILHYLKPNRKENDPFYEKLKNKLKFDLITNLKGSLEYCKEIRDNGLIGEKELPSNPVEPYFISDDKDFGEWAGVIGTALQTYPISGIGFLYSTDASTNVISMKLKSGKSQIRVNGKDYIIPGSINGQTIFKHLSGRQISVDDNASGSCFNLNDNSKCDITKLRGSYRNVENFKFINNKLYVLLVRINSPDDQTNCARERLILDDAVWIEFYKDSNFMPNIQVLGC